MLASAEGLALGEKLGCDRTVLRDILQDSTSNNWCLNKRRLSSASEDGLEVTRIRKDLSVAMDCAQSVRVGTKIAKSALLEYMKLEIEGHGKEDFGFTLNLAKK
mmetsp:Transcript_10192/g.15530  ORF Transcript_10192/g.15530 Transcript_10192/m.15530 type:complete len:104 (-) Transcript_10192:22-333(-)